MAPFIDYIKFPLWNLNIKNLMLINFHISLITKRFLRSFDRHSDNTVTQSKLLRNVNKFRNKILIFFQKVSRMWLINCSSYCDTCLESHSFFQVMPPREFILLLSFFFNGSQNWVHLPIFFTPWVVLMHSHFLSIINCITELKFSNINIDNNVFYISIIFVSKAKYYNHLFHPNRFIFFQSNAVDYTKPINF